MKGFKPDVLIVGGGPAGSTAAGILAGKGADVLVLERKEEIGIPVQCAEYVPARIMDHANIKDLVSQPIEEMVTHLPNGEEASGEIGGFTIERDKLDRRIANDAEEKGARFLLNTEAVEFDGERIIARHGKTIKIKPRIIIGADGPRSVVATWADTEKREFIVGMQWTLPLRKELRENHIFFTPEIPGGYGWLFPKREVANVGICIDIAVNEKLLSLENFVFGLIGKGLVDKDILRKTTGLIPVSGIGKVRHGNILLAGDAASLTDPMTGEGLLNALISGKFAANSALKALEGNDLEILSEFEKECENSFSSLERSSARREYLNNFWNSDTDELSSAIRKSWFAFPEYYK